jgi:hypothetical protein
MNRKHFFLKTVFSAGAVMASPLTDFSQALQEPPRPAPLPADKVKDFVIAGHGNLSLTKQMLTEMPALLYATWDWGGGDFETALEGAGHTGNREIAQYLIEMGARTNLFVLTMLGRTALVKAYLELYPQYLNARGPHGLTLLHHAQKGGADAKELADYLQSKGLTAIKMKL